ncbi:MAG: hypothetical protein LUQ38_02600 [Methanotrichaceae archaeon]|nr:hypothetical protein [Methanotrichaceae archaeon]MDD1758816.1 hypothetical protein [Methanotrichaceae archaeon]
MRKAIAFLATVVLIMLAMNIVGSKPVSSALTYSIDNNRIAPMGVAPGNSNMMAIDVSVTQLGNSICGLNADNFILDTLKVPSNGQNVAIYSVGASSASRGGSHSSCNYSLNLAPASYQGKQYTWVEGIYTFQLGYVKNGQQLANRTFNFTVKEALSDLAAINKTPFSLTPY